MGEGVVRELGGGPSQGARPPPPGMQAASARIRFSGPPHHCHTGIFTAEQAERPRNSISAGTLHLWQPSRTTGSQWPSPLSDVVRVLRGEGL